MQDRKLATIRKISELKPIDGADKIELAIIDGWQVVVKKGEFTEGSLVVFVEVDSFVSHALAPFLTKPGHFPKVYEGVEGQRLRSVRLRGVLSQGLVLPLVVLETEQESECNVFDMSEFNEGDDVTELLGILKWEKPLPAALAGFAKGNFPSFLIKTDQERIQNLSRTLENPDGGLQGYTYEVTEKLHGSSCSFAVRKNEDALEFFVCSRNLSLKIDESNAENTYVKMYNDLGMQEILTNCLAEEDPVGSFFAIQGELCGPGINGNQYGLSKHEFYVFDMQGMFGGATEASYCAGGIRRDFCKEVGLKHAPYLGNVYVNAQTTVASLLEQAEGKSVINASNREGLVYKRTQDGKNVSFKTISNQWLISGGDDQ